VAPRPLPFERPAVAGRIAAVSRIERAEPADHPFVNRPLRDLVGGIPSGAIAHAGHRPAVDGVALRIADDAIHLPVAIGRLPRAIVVLHVETGEQMATADARRGRYQRPREALVSPADAGHAFVEHVR